MKVIWRGAASRERARQTLWKGQVKLSTGRIVEARPYRLDHTGERVEVTGVDTLAFDTMTAGDEDGMILRFEAPPDAELSFDALTSARNQFGALGAQGTKIAFSIPVAQIGTEDRVHPAGGVDREVVVRRVGTGYPRSVSFDWREPAEAPGGTSAYWVRVLQSDGATAWSSPIFVTR